MLPYLGPELIRALLQQDEVPSSSLQLSPRKSSGGRRPTHSRAARLLREITQHKLMLMAVGVVKRWFV
jgi:hypothetical protein